MEKPRKKHPVLVELGLRVKRERDARDWTQAFLAEKVGVDRTYIGSIERGEKNVGILIVNRLALVLGRSAIGFTPCSLERVPRHVPARPARPARTNRSK